MLYDKIQTGVPSVTSLTAAAPKTEDAKLREYYLIRQDMTDIFAGIRNVRAFQQNFGLNIKNK